MLCACVVICDFWNVLECASCVLLVYLSLNLNRYKRQQSRHFSFRVNKNKAAIHFDPPASVTPPLHLSSPCIKHWHIDIIKLNSWWVGKVILRKGPQFRACDATSRFWSGDTIEMDVFCLSAMRTQNVLKVVEQPSIPHVSENRGSFEWASKVCLSHCFQDIHLKQHSWQVKAIIISLVGCRERWITCQRWAQTCMQ